MESTYSAEFKQLQACTDTNHVSEIVEAALSAAGISEESAGEAYGETAKAIIANGGENSRWDKIEASGKNAEDLANFLKDADDKWFQIEV